MFCLERGLPCPLKGLFSRLRGIFDPSLLPDGLVASFLSCLCLGWLDSSVCGPGMPLTWWEVEQEEALDFQASASCQPLEKGVGRHLSHKAVS